MIGKKPLSAIRADLLEQFRKAGIDPAVWFDEQIRKLEKGKAPSLYEIETLKLIRDGLKRRTQSAKSAGKRTEEKPGRRENT